jgi:hypothetical protein
MARRFFPPAAPTTCTDCVNTSKGDKLIKASATGSYFGAANCALIATNTLAGCSKFYYTGTKQAMDCRGTKTCYAQVQLTPGGGGATYWLFSHVCGQGQDNSIIVETTNPACGVCLAAMLPLPLPPALHQRACQNTGAFLLALAVPALVFSVLCAAPLSPALNAVKTCSGCDQACQVCNTATGLCDNKATGTSCNSGGGTCSAGRCVTGAGLHCAVCIC